MFVLLSASMIYLKSVSMHGDPIGLVVVGGILFRLPSLNKLHKEVESVVD